jgi:hypothetical protein
LSYEGTGNVYEISATGGDDQNDVGLEGQIQNVNGTSELEMKLSENGNYQVVTMPSDITALDPYDLEGVALVMKELANPAISTVEAAGPDYTCHWFGADCGIASPSNELNIPCPPPDECCVPAQPCDVVGSPVIFTNSPCLAVWGGIKVEDYGSGSLFRRTIADHHKNTPMSGDVTGGIAVYRDALYAIDISVGKNAILRNSDPLASPQDSVHIYYDDCEIECNSNISGCPASVKCNSATPPNCECGVLDMQEGKIHREAVITVYGDFDGDKGSVTDTDDLTFFNSAFPSCHNSVSAGTCPCGGGGSEPGCDAYNPLVDYNCNKIIDCTDWQAFVAYRGTSSGVNTELSCTP